MEGLAENASVRNYNDDIVQSHTKSFLERISADMKHIPNNLSHDFSDIPSIDLIGDIHSTSSSDTSSGEHNIHLALQTLVNARNSQPTSAKTPTNTLSVSIPSYISAFDKVQENDSVAIEIGDALSPVTHNIQYKIHDVIHDTTKHLSPIKINAFQNPDITSENEIELNDYTHNHEPITHDPNLLHSRAKSLRHLHSADIDNMCIRSNSPALFSKNNSNNNSFHGGSRSGSGSDTDSYMQKHDIHDYNSDFDNHSQLLHPPTSDVFSYAPLPNHQIAVSGRALQKRIAPPTENAIVHKKYKKLTYDDVSKSLSHYYDDYNKYSNEMDVLITFIRGQKHLFLQSTHVTSFKLYSMLFLALCITAFVTVVTPFIEDYKWNVVLITSCNACATTVISMTRYWNFEFSNSAYTFLSNNYDKLEHSLEIANNKLTFIDTEHEQSKIVLDKIKEIEFKIGEMRDVFQVNIPHEVIKLFPVISHVNIFSFIKKMETHKRRLIIKYRDIKNEINYTMYKLKERAMNDYEMDENDYNVDKRRILYLNEVKDKIKSELINYKDAYNQIDILFTKEIQFAEQHVNTVYALPMYLWWFGEPAYLDVNRYSNPVIQEYLKLIIGG